MCLAEGRKQPSRREKRKLLKQKPEFRETDTEKDCRKAVDFHTIQNYTGQKGKDMLFGCALPSRKSVERHKTDSSLAAF